MSISYIFLGNLNQNASQVDREFGLLTSKRKFRSCPRFSVPLLTTEAPHIHRFHSHNFKYLKCICRGHKGDDALTCSALGVATVPDPTLVHNFSMT